MTNTKYALPLAFILILILSFHSIYLFNNNSLTQKNSYYFPSSKYIETVSGSFKSLAGHLLFIKGVLDFSEKIPNRMDYLTNLFSTVIELDPKLIDAYFFGGVVAPRNNQEALEAIEFLKKNSKHAPDRWEIPFWIGLSYYETGKHKEAIEYYKKAASLDGSPNYIKSNLAMLYHKANQEKTGLAFLESLYLSIDDPHLLDIIKFKIEWLKNIVILQSKINDYQRIKGFWPQDLNELVKSGLIQKIPDDPFGDGYYIEPPISIKDIPKIKSKFGQ